jgi:hypothetical protein
MVASQPPTSGLVKQHLNTVFCSRPPLRVLSLVGWPQCAHPPFLCISMPEQGARRSLAARRRIGEADAGARAWQGSSAARASSRRALAPPLASPLGALAHRARAPPAAGRELCTPRVRLRPAPSSRASPAAGEEAAATPGKRKEESGERGERLGR